MSLPGYIPKTKPANWTTVPGALTPVERYLKKPNRRSAKRIKSDRLYQEAARQFRTDPANSFCRVHFALTGEKVTATCIHHIRGRHRTLKFDQRFFCPVAFQNSLWPHANIERARALGLIAQAGDWAREPHDEETARIEEWMREKGIL
jgi:hypothetical protein